ncbi:MAG: hypothetical protein ABI830_11765, partial [Pseudolabrys sp.]
AAAFQAEYEGSIPFTRSNFLNHLSSMVRPQLIRARRVVVSVFSKCIYGYPGIADISFDGSKFCF